MKSIRFACSMLASIFFFSACGNGPNNKATPDQVFSTLTNAVSTSMAVEGLTFARLNPHAFSVTLDPKCGTHGEPLDNVGNLIPSNSPSYAAAFFYCLANQPSGGEDTLLGAIYLSAGLSCMLKDQIHFNGTPESITLTIDSSCFPDSFVAENGGTGAELSARVTVSPVGAPLFGDASQWDYSVEIETSDGTGLIDVRLLFKANDNEYAASANTNVSGHTNDAFSVHLDLAGGVLRYESKNQRYSEACGTGSCGWNRHNRLLVNGNVAANGTFSAVTLIEGATSNLFKHDPSPSTDSGNLMTIKGDPVAGFYTHNLQFQSNPAAVTDFSSDVASCSVSGGCSGNTGIAISSTSDLDFLMIPTGAHFTPGATWFENSAPLSYTSVTTADSQ